MKVALLLVLPLILSLGIVASIPTSDAISPNVPEFAKAHVVTTSSSSASDNAPEKNHNAEGKPDPKPKRP